MAEAAGVPARYDGAMKLPQHHLRDLFWLTLVIGLGLGWWIDRFGIARERTTLRTQLSDLEEGLGSKGIQVEWSPNGGYFLRFPSGGGVGHPGSLP